MTYSQRALEHLTSFPLIMNSVNNFLSGVPFAFLFSFLFHFAVQTLPMGLELCSFSLITQQTELTHRVQDSPKRYMPCGSAAAWPLASSQEASRSREQSSSCVMLSFARKSKGPCLSGSNNLFVTRNMLFLRSLLPPG